MRHGAGKVDAAQPPAWAENVDAAQPPAGYGAGRGVDSEMPPSTTMTTPVTYLARSEERYTAAPDGFVSLMGRLTASVSGSTMALVDDGALIGSRQFDMGNSG